MIFYIIKHFDAVFYRLQNIRGGEKLILKKKFSTLLWILCRTSQDVVMTRILLDYGCQHKFKIMELKIETFFGSK
jgi:hypothetical protein